MTSEIVDRDALRAGEQKSEDPRKVENAEPVFLVGSRRSGSTLFRVMLASHPDVTFRRHAEIEHAFRLITPERGVPSDTSQYLAAIEGDYECVQSGLRVDRSLPMVELLRKFWSEFAREDGSAVNMGTVHSNFSQIPRVWPDAKFIYLYRDGRDVARSRINLDWEGSYWSAIKKWVESEDEWARMKSELKPGTYIEVRYEDLILGTSDTLEKVCAFLGIPFSSDVMNYTETSSYREPDPRLVGQWRKDATEMDIRSAESLAGEHLRGRGYELSGLPSMEVSVSMARRFDRVGIWSRRYRRLRFRGPVNYLLEAVSRRLGLSRLHTRVSLSINKRRDRIIS